MLLSPGMCWAEFRSRALVVPFLPQISCLAKAKKNKSHFSASKRWAVLSSSSGPCWSPPPCPNQTAARAGTRTNSQLCSGGKRSPKAWAQITKNPNYNKQRRRACTKPPTHSTQPRLPTAQLLCRGCSASQLVFLGVLAVWAHSELPWAVLAPCLLCSSLKSCCRTHWAGAQKNGNGSALEVLKKPFLLPACPLGAVSKTESPQPWENTRAGGQAAVRDVGCASGKGLEAGIWGLSMEKEDAGSWWLWGAGGSSPGFGSWVLLATPTGGRGTPSRAPLIHPGSL